MPAVLFVLFLVMPLVEFYVIVQVGQELGVLETLGLLLLVSFLGTWLVRREGMRAWRAFQRATEAGRVPAREVADGFLILLAGALLLTPGFVTDAFALVLLLPPTRAFLRRMAVALAVRRAPVVTVVTTGGSWAAARVRDRRATQTQRDAPPPPSHPPD